jgi:hypothetical protein
VTLKAEALAPSKAVWRFASHRSPNTPGGCETSVNERAKHSDRVEMKLRQQIVPLPQPFASEITANLARTSARVSGKILCLVVIGNDNLVHNHVVTFLHVVDADLRVLSDSSGVNHLSLRCYVGNSFTESIVDRRTRSGTEDD